MHRGLGGRGACEGMVEDEEDDMMEGEGEGMGEGAGVGRVDEGEGMEPGMEG